MLHRRDADIAVDQGGGQTRIAHAVRARVDVDRRIEVGATKHDAGVGRCRAQGHVDLVAGVQAHAGRADDVLERTLLDHFLGYPWTAAARLVGDANTVLTSDNSKPDRTVFSPPSCFGAPRDPAKRSGAFPNHALTKTENLLAGDGSPARRRAAGHPDTQLC